MSDVDVLMSYVLAIVLFVNCAYVCKAMGSVTLPIASNTNKYRMQTNGLTIQLRQFMYFKRVKRDLDIGRATVMQLCILMQLLILRKCLYLSIAEMLESGLYDYWVMRPKILADCFDDLVRKGYMVRSYRDSKRTKGAKVLVWGITGKGKSFIKEYYAYIEGAHDDLLFEAGYLQRHTA